MAEWQTRTVQVRVLERVWGFKSPLAHKTMAPLHLKGAIHILGVRSHPMMRFLKDL